MNSSAERLDRTLGALADPVRRRAVELLGDRPRRAGELAEELEVTPSVMSRHLRVLRDGGLVTDTHPDFDARVRVYTLRAAAMADLRDWLARAEQGWSEQLASFAAFINADSDAGDQGPPATRQSAPEVKSKGPR